MKSVGLVWRSVVMPLLWALELAGACPKRFLFTLTFTLAAVCSLDLLIDLKGGVSFLGKKLLTVFLPGHPALHKALPCWPLDLATDLSTAMGVQGAWQVRVLPAWHE